MWGTATGTAASILKSWLRWMLEKNHPRLLSLLHLLPLHSWGIQDEMTLDHKTWVECARGIDWCVANSTGIAFFLSLQGDKFGYTPLPKSILQTDLDAHLQHCPEGKHFLCCIIGSLTLSIKTSSVWRVTGIALMIMLYRRSMSDEKYYPLAS
jgi:hypothetical protein